jgi:hypothetical protein
METDMKYVIDDQQVAKRVVSGFMQKYAITKADLVGHVVTAGSGTRTSYQALRHIMSEGRDPGRFLDHYLPQILVALDEVLRARGLNVRLKIQPMIIEEVEGNGTITQEG